MTFYDISEDTLHVPGACKKHSKRQMLHRRQPSLVQLAAQATARFAIRRVAGTMQLQEFSLFFGNCDYRPVTARK
jgi:hypothetical protein